MFSDVLRQTVEMLSRIIRLISSVKTVSIWAWPSGLPRSGMLPGCRPGEMICRLSALVVSMLAMMPGVMTTGGDTPGRFRNGFG